MTGSDKSEWDYMAAELAFSILLLLHRSLSAQSNSGSHEVRLMTFVL